MRYLLFCLLLFSTIAPAAEFDKSCEYRLAAKTVFEEFHKFYSELPQDLQKMIESFGPGEGWASGAEMRAEMAAGRGPYKMFMLNLHENPDAANRFVIDEAVQAPALRDGVVHLPKSLGQHRVIVQQIRLH